MLQHKLLAKKSKCVYGVPSVEYLGHFISTKGVATDPNKIVAIEEELHYFTDEGRRIYHRLLC